MFPAQVKPFTSLTPESARAKRERRWAMRLLREGCADDASGRLLRNSRALPRLFAHLDCVGTGGWRVRYRLRQFVSTRGTAWLRRQPGCCLRCCFGHGCMMVADLLLGPKKG